MSMFHELMMRKKEQIMYATIKGSLTENDGVFSGFSGSKYLEMQQAIPNLDINSFLEIELKVTMPETITRQQIVGSNNLNYEGNATYDIGFQVYDDNRLLAHCYNSTTNERYNIFVTSPSALNGKVCYIKYIITNSRMTTSLSFDKISWVSNYYALPTTFSYTKTSYSIFGWGKGNSAFTGTIDLPNSYIKLGSTKYKLQAVVGYTIVGSPTIVDGVVSGFSTDDYLQTANTTSNENIELYTRFKFNSSESGQKPIFSFKDKWALPFCFAIANRISGYAGDVYANLQNNTWYRIKVIYNGTVATCEVYNDNNILIASNSREYSATIQQAVIRIGGTYSTLSVVIDSIDLNETYIKVNNKLWFNGQQA